MHYTIGQISKMFQFPVSTLRYYDKEGLFPNIERASGIRKFGENEIEALRVIECLKKSGMEIKDVKLWSYDQAIKAGNEEHLHQMLPDKLPAEIQSIYNHARED